MPCLSLSKRVCVCIRQFVCLCGWLFVCGCETDAFVHRERELSVWLAGCLKVSARLTVYVYVCGWRGGVCVCE